jgi:hypothetical protein
MTGAGCGIADVNPPQHSIKWREKSGLAAKRAARLLPGYRRVALERMAKTASRTDEGLH